MSFTGSLFIYLLNRRWLFAGLLVTILFSLASPPTGLSHEGWKSIGLALAALIWFIKRPVGNPEIALLIIVLHVILGIASDEEVARSFFNDSVFFIMGVLMLGTAIINQRLDRSLGKMLIRMSGGSMDRFIVYVIFFSALTTSVIGEYAASALFLPFILTIMLKEENRFLRRTVAKPVLFALAFGCIIGGAVAPSGGARNVIIIQFLKEQHRYSMNYLTWVKLTFPLLIAGVIVLSILIIRSFPARRIRSISLDASTFDEEWKKPLTAEDKSALLILLVTVALWFVFSDRLGMGIIALFGASLFLILGLVKWEDYNKNVNWGVIILYSSMIMLGSSLYDKGGAQWLANNISDNLISPESMPLYLPIVIALVFPLISNLTGAVGAVAIFSPVILKLTTISGMNPVNVGVLIAVASSFAFLSFKGSPASAIVYTTGYLKKTGFLKLGWKMMLFSAIVLVLISKFYWNFI